MKTLSALLMGLILSLFAPTAVMALDDFRPAAVSLDGDGKGKKGKHGKKKGKKGKKKSKKGAKNHKGGPRKHHKHKK
jgi:hypothetical protein